MTGNLIGRIEDREGRNCGRLCCGGIMAAALALSIGPGQGQTFTMLKSFGSFSNATGYEPQGTLVQGADGALYGTASGGEGSIAGTVFKMQPDGSGFMVLKFFTNSTEGADPMAGLVVAGNALYGTTYNGGSFDRGTIFKLNTDGTGYTVLRSFAGYPEGSSPTIPLVLDGNVIYGATSGGGSSGDGCIFRMNTDGTSYLQLKSFNINTSDGAQPSALALSDGVLYGTARAGAGGGGTVFKMSTNGGGYTVLRTFPVTSTVHPIPNGLLVWSNMLFGTTYLGGGSNAGTVFSLRTDGMAFTFLKEFHVSDGTRPSGGLVLQDGALYGTTQDGGALNGGTVFKVNTNGSGFAVLRDLAQSDGTQPSAGLLFSSGSLYGATTQGGSSDSGTIFRVNPAGTGYTVLKSFAASEGVSPIGGVTLVSNVIYGTTSVGGNSGTGTVFKVNTDGSGFSVLKSFSGGDGGSPQAALAFSSNMLYGTTCFGGASNYGTVFRMSMDGSGYTVLKHFTNPVPWLDWTNSDGGRPVAGLVLSGKSLYGTTQDGGPYGDSSGQFGVVFKINTDGADYAILKPFTRYDGRNPAAGVTLSGEVLYGTTYRGGSSDYGTVFKLNKDGTGFTSLYQFSGNDGAYPFGDLVLSGSMLYGTTARGGDANYGTVFAVDTNGLGFTVVKNFSGPSDGAYPFFGFTPAGNVFYGITQVGPNGPSSDAGTVFQMNTDGTGYTFVKQFVHSDGAIVAGPLRLLGNVLYGVTFAGGALDEGTLFKIQLPPPGILTIQSSGDAVVLGWTNPACTLQGAGSASGGYTNIAGAASPYTNAPAGDQTYFRLMVP